MTTPYVEVSVTLPTHPKTMRAARALRVHPGIILFHLVHLWGWVMLHAPNGDVTRYSDRDLADAAQFTRPEDFSEEADTYAAAFVSALTECRIADGGAGFIECTPDGRRIICMDGLARLRNLTVYEEWAALRSVLSPIVFRRDQYRCVYCGSEQDLTVDHILPLSRGGNNQLDNLATACRCCNSSKNNKTPEEWQAR